MRDAWFDNCGGVRPAHDLDALREGIARGEVDRQDAYGATALMLAAGSDWAAGIDLLLRAGADTERRYRRTGSTALYEVALNHRADTAAALVAGGADPDAPNYWGVTPRRWDPGLFAAVPVRPQPLPEPVIQNAEHLADHHHPRFKIPRESERVSLQPGQAVNLYVYGPKSDGRGDEVKVRITARTGDGRGVVYTATVETPVAQTHLRPGTDAVTFGPEHVATVFVSGKGRRA